MEHQPDITFVGAFRTEDDAEMLQAYTATVTANVSPKAPQGFKEFFHRVKEINPIESRADVYEVPGHQWYGDSYTDVFEVIYEYPEYFDVVSVESEDIDNNIIEKVSLDELVGIGFFS